MSRIKYISGSDGTVFEMDGPNAYVGVGDGLRSRAWERTLSARDVTGFVQRVREVDVSMAVTDEQANEMRRAFDRDISRSTPGELVVDGEWRMQCYVPESSLEGAYHQGWQQVGLTIALLSRFWWREKVKEFKSGVGQSGIDYPHDHEHDLGFTSGKGEAVVSSALDSPIRITFYGPCLSPYITVAGNRYEVDVSVPSGSKLVIDATGSSPTVMLYDQYGNGTSQFSKAVRDGGQGGGSYAFEPLKPGTHQVTWSGSFAFDLAWREQETEPPWSR